MLNLSKYANNAPSTLLAVSLSEFGIGTREQLYEISLDFQKQLDNNSEGIKIPSDYLVERLGRPN